jgi:hypothetical protein
MILSILASFTIVIESSGEFLKSIIRSLVREILMEDQAYKRVTGKKYTADIEMFRDNVDKPGYYIHLTDVPKLGINPQTSYLPGLYLYKNTRENFLSVLGTGGSGSDVSAARYARYVYLVKLKDDVKLLQGGRELEEHIDKKYKSAVVPVLEELLDTRLMKNPVNASQYYGKDGGFTRWEAIGSIVPVLEVTPEMLDEIGDNRFIDNVNRAIGLISELRSIIPLKGKARTERATEVNGRIAKFLKDNGNYVTIQDTAPFSTGRHYSSGDMQYGPKVGKTGVVSPQGIDKAIKSLNSYIADFVEVGADGVASISREKISVWSKEYMKSKYSRPSAPRVFGSIADLYRNSAMFYFEIVRAAAAEPRAIAIQKLGDPLRNNRMLMGKDGNPINGNEVAEKVLTSLCSAMSYPGKTVTPEYLKKYYGKEELNILLALGGSDYDGVEDLGMRREGGSKVGVLGVEASQTFIKPPIGSKLEGGGPVVMVDRLEGEPADLKLQGSMHLGAPWDPAPPRAGVIGSRRSRSDTEVLSVKRKTGEDISRAKERYSTAGNFPKDG